MDRLALTSTDQVRYQLETPYRDGTTRIVLEPLDFMPARRDRGKKKAEEGTDQLTVPCHVAMSWAQHLKRVLGIEIEARALQLAAVQHDSSYFL